VNLRRLVVAFACVSLLGGAACSKCGGEGNEADAAANEPLPQAPEKLIADIYFTAPNTSWGKLQRGVGGALGILPAVAGGMVCLAFGIDPTFSQEIDGVAPAYGVLSDDPADPSWAVALKLVDPRRAKMIITDDAGRFTAREGAGFTELVPRGDAGAPTNGLALTRSGYLVVTKSSADLPKLAGYVSRTLPAQKLPEGGIIVDVSRRAIETVLAPKAESLWGVAKEWLHAQDAAGRRSHGGRAPDYGDPEAIVGVLDGAVASRITTLKDLDHVRFVFDIEDEDVVLSATLTPRAGGGPASKWIDGMLVGDANDVLAMPSDSALALTTRDSEPTRAAQAAGFENALETSAGMRLGDAGVQRVKDLSADATKARGDVLGFALGWDEPRVTFLRGAVRDQEAAERAVKAAVELVRNAPFKEMLHVKDVAVAAQDVPQLGKIEVATITREKPDGGAPRMRQALDAGAPPAPKTPGIAWRIEPARIEAAVADDPANALLVSARPAKKLGDEPGVVRATKPLGSDASTIVVAQPLRLDPRRASLPVSPVVLGVGRHDKDAFVRIDIGDGVLRELTRVLMGL
jgi:hypothetical protein